MAPGFRKQSQYSSLSEHQCFLHRLELAIRNSGPQDILNGNNVVMLEMLEDLQLPEGPLCIGHHIKSIRDLLDSNLLA